MVDREAVQRVIEKARREVSERSHKSPFDGTLVFGTRARLDDAKLNSFRALDELYEACAENWRRSGRDDSLVRELARRDDDETKRRYLKRLEYIDSNLLVPTLPTKPPPGFPKTTGGRPICARCNTARGCDAPAIVGESTLTSMLSETMTKRQEDALKVLLETAVATPLCIHGVHERVHCAREFSSWFNLPGLGGFQPYLTADPKTGRSTSFERIADELYRAILKEHDVHAILKHREINSSDDDDSTFARHILLAARCVQAEYCEWLRKFWAKWTRRPFVIKLRDSRTSNRFSTCYQDNHKSNGQVTTLAFEEEQEEPLPTKPPVCVASYSSLAELSKGAARVGASQQTFGVTIPPQLKDKVKDYVEWSDDVDFFPGGAVVAAERRLTLASRIAVQHAKESRRLEAIDRSTARRNPLWRERRRRLIASLSKQQQRRELVSGIGEKDLSKVTALVLRAGEEGQQLSELETTAGMTALMATVLTSDREAANRLAQTTRIDLDYPSKRLGVSALGLACKRDNAVMVHHLLDLGASPFLQKKYAIVEKGRHYVIPPSAAAAMAGQIRSLTVLLDRVENESGASAVSKLLNQRFGPRRRTALHFTVYRRDVRTTLLLLSKGARSDVFDLEKRRPIDFAPRKSPLESFFSSAGNSSWSTTAADMQKKSVLAHAKLDKAIKELAKASSDERTIAKENADDSLMEQLSEARKEVSAKARQLLEIIRDDQFTNPDLETELGATPLISAASCPRVVIESLLRLGCSPNYANKNYRTPLMAAAAIGNVEGVLALLRRGADATLKDLDGRSAACFALSGKSSTETEASNQSMLNDMLKKAATTTNEIAIDQFEARQAAASAIRSYQTSPSNDERREDISWKWRLARSDRLALSTRVAQDSLNDLSSEESTEFTAMMSKSVQGRLEEEHKHEEYRDRDRSYVLSLKSSYFARYGAKTLDRFLKQGSEAVLQESHVGAPPAPSTSCLAPLLDCGAPAPAVPSFSSSTELTQSEAPARPRDALDRFFLGEEDDLLLWFVGNNDEDDERTLAEEFRILKESAVDVTNFASSIGQRSCRRRRRRDLDSGDSEVDKLLIVAPPEYEYATYMASRGRYEEALATLATIREKQQKSTFADDDAKAFTLARTEGEMARLEEALGRPHRALRKRRRSLAVFLKILGPGCEGSALRRHIVEKSVSDLAHLYIDKLDAREMAIELYKNLVEAYAPSRLPHIRQFALEMLNGQVSLS